MELQPAFVLHTRPWRETSLLVELLTLEGGRVGVIARGVRRASSNRKGLLQPFLPLLVGLKGRSELKNLAQIEAVSAPITLSGEHLYCGLYLNELLMRLLARELSFPQLFSRYRAVLVDLACKEAAEPLLRRFEMGLLQELGILPSLREAYGQPVEAELYYRWQPEVGFIPVAKAGRAFFSGELLLSLAEESLLPKALWPEAKRLSRQLLKPLLGSRPLHSRGLFQRAVTERGRSE